MHQCRHRRAGDICDRFTLSVGSTFVARSQTVGRKDTWEEETAGMRCLSSAGVLLCLGVAVCQRACLDTSLSLSLCTCLVLLILPAQASGFPIRSRGPHNSLVLNTAHASLGSLGTPEQQNRITEMCATSEMRGDVVEPDGDEEYLQSDGEDIDEPEEQPVA